MLIDAAKTVTAKFVTSRRLTLSKDGGRIGDDPVSAGGHRLWAHVRRRLCARLECDADGVTVAGLYFVKWSGACTSFSVVCTVSLDAERARSPPFELGPVLTVKRTGTGTGVVTSDPAGIDCGTQCTMSAGRPSDTIRLQARADDDSVFMALSDGCNTNLDQCFVNMDKDQVVSAYFAFKPMLDIQIAGVGGKGHVIASAGSIDCDGANATCHTRLEGNSQVVITAMPNPNGRFDGWSGACTSTAPSCTVTMNTRKTVTATFGDASTPPPNNGGGGGKGGGGRFDLLSLLGLALVGTLRLLRRGCAATSS